MRFTYLFLVCTTAALFAACQPAPEEAATPEAAAETAMSDEDMLNAFTDTFAEAWADADAAALTALHAEQADTVGPDGVRFHGREAIHGRFEGLLSGMYQGTTLSLAQTSVSFPSPEVAVVNGSYTIHGVKTADGAEMTQDGLYLNVMVKQDGQWLIHCSRPMLPMPAPNTVT